VNQADYVAAGLSHFSAPIPFSERRDTPVPGGRSGDLMAVSLRGSDKLLLANASFVVCWIRRRQRKVVAATATQPNRLPASKARTGATLVTIHASSR
jgi:hypothetical protein